MNDAAGLCGHATGRSLRLERENRFAGITSRALHRRVTKADWCTSGYASQRYGIPERTGFCQKSVTNVLQSACPILCRSELSSRKIRVFLTKHKGNRGWLPDLCPFSNRMSGRLPQTPHPSKLVIA
ncbi:hypothetical protein FHT69_002217 [Rhizobium sp. BK008]|nr:hypothetical protein [Rhizobium sp. BK008]